MSIPVDTGISPQTTPAQPNRSRVRAFFGTLIFSFAIAGLSLDLFQMGRIFWAVLLVWLLVMRLLIVIKRPMAPARKTVHEGPTS